MVPTAETDQTLGAWKMLEWKACTQKISQIYCYTQYVPNMIIE